MTTQKTYVAKWSLIWETAGFSLVVKNFPAESQHISPAFALSWSLFSMEIIEIELKLGQILFTNIFLISLVFSLPIFVHVEL
jgi:hypothetical protein